MVAYRSRILVYVVTFCAALVWVLASSPGPAQAEDQSASDAGRVASQGTPPWPPCGAHDKKTKVLYQYKRAAIAGVAGARATLACGTSEWGFLHIKKGHLSQWEAKAAPLFVPWMDVAHWAITNALTFPCSTLRQGFNDTILYVGRFELRDRGGALIQRFGVRVVVSRTTQNIITAFPVSKAC